MKMYVKKEDLNKEELRTGKVSYSRVIEKFIGNIVLCNNIEELDDSIFENAVNLYNKDMKKKTEIYQYYLCNIDEWEKEQLIEMGIIISYSDMLGCNVLMVDHFGTSWDYVMTDIEWTENIEESC